MFDSLWEFPFCFWVVDEFHIPIKYPAGSLEASKEHQKFFYSVVLMAMVDFQYRFLSASCGHLGNR